MVDNYTSTVMVKIWNTDNTKYRRGCRTTEILIVCWCEWKTLLPHRKTICWFSTELNILLPYNHAFWYLPKRVKKNDYTTTCTWMFTATLFIFVKTFKGPKCLSEDEWINKWWYILTMQHHYSVQKKKWNVWPWKDLEET